MKKFTKKSSSSGLFEVHGISAISEYIKAGVEVKNFSITNGDWDNLQQKVEKSDLKKIEKQFKKSGPAEAMCSHKLVDWKSACAKLKDQNHEKSTILALDGVTDPRNVGAIIRSAGFFGIKTVVVKKRNQSLLTQAAVETAQGGFAWVDMVVVSNLNHAITDLKKIGYWILAADAHGSQDISKVAKEYPKKMVILGAEQTGISRLVKENSDLILTIPKIGDIESLNVSVAAGILSFVCSVD